MCYLGVCMTIFLNGDHGKWCKLKVVLKFFLKFIMKTAIAESFFLKL